MTSWDYSVIVILLGFIVSFGIRFCKKSSASSEEFILAGRKLRWWLAGTSASAGAYNADSPLHHSRKVRETGFAGAWYYWGSILSSIINVVIMGKLYRRARITTVVEFYQIRYGGKLQHLARFLNAFHVSILHGSALVAMGLLGLLKLTKVLFGVTGTVDIFGVPVETAVLITLGVMGAALFYSTLAGLLGIVWTDVIEFSVAVCSSYILFGIVYWEIGGSTGLKEQLGTLADSSRYLSFSPEMGFMLFFWLVVLQVSRIDGAATDTHRYMAVRHEKEVLMTGFWRITNTYLIRGWPWYFCGVISIFLISDTFLLENFGPLGGGKADLELAYPLLINQYMPAGLKGLMVAGFLFAFMSSVDTVTHHNASVFVNDIYRPLSGGKYEDKHYVMATRVCLIGSAVLGALLAFQFDEIWDIILFFVTYQSATGIIRWARWFWWRINIKADLFAQIIAVPITLVFYHPSLVFGASGFDPTQTIMDVSGIRGFDGKLAVMVSSVLFFSTSGWVLVALLTKPEDEKVLIDFYKRVRPYGFWGPIKDKCKDYPSPDNFSEDIALIFLASGFFFNLLMAVGCLLFAYWGWGIVFTAASIVFGSYLLPRMKKYGI